MVLQKSLHERKYYKIIYMIKIIEFICENQAVLISVAAWIIRMIEKKKMKRVFRVDLDKTYHSALRDAMDLMKNGQK